MATIITPDEALEIREKLPARIKFVRKYLGMTQQEFSNKIGVSRSYLSEVENKKGKPTIEMVLGIAREFPNIRPAWLLTAIGPMTEHEKAPFDDSQSIDKLALLVSMKEMDKVIARLGETPSVEMRAAFLAIVYNAYMDIYGECKDLPNYGEEFSRYTAETRCRVISRNFDLDFLQALIAMGPPMPLFPDRESDSNE